MPDITMCSGEGCPAKDGCYRHTAEPNGLMQSYFVDPPIEDGKCEMFWGDTQTSIWEQLQEIVSPKNKDEEE